MRRMGWMLGCVREMEFFLLCSFVNFARVSLLRLTGVRRFRFVATTVGRDSEQTLGYRVGGGDTVIGVV